MLVETVETLAHEVVLAEPEGRRRSHATAEVCNLVLAYLEAPPA